MNEDDKKIKFPEKHYVGFQPRKDHVHLGFMTPYGTDSAAKKRMGTVDNWAKNSRRQFDYKTREYYETEEIPPIIYDNGPLEGFLVSNPVNHSSSWNSCRDKWRVEDPRGFELEITSGNLEKIMNICTLERGLIKGKCIWARLGAENILVPVDSEIYLNAKNNTDRYNTSVSIREVPTGARVELQDGRIFNYIGFLYAVIGNTRWSKDDRLDVFRTSHKKIHVFEHVDFAKSGSFVGIASPKISSFKPDGIYERKFKDGIEAYVNKNFKDMTSHSYYGIVGVSESPYVTHHNELIENMSREDAKTLGYYRGFLPHEDESMKCILASSECIYHGDGRVRYDVVRSLDDLTVIKRYDEKYHRNYRNDQIKMSIPVPNRFNCIRSVIDTGKSKIYVKL